VEVKGLKMNVGKTKQSLALTVWVGCNGSQMTLQCV